MPKRTSLAARGLFAVLVAAGLTSGAGAALAAPDPRPLCAYEPESGRIGVACYTNETCTDACTQWWGGWNPGFCGDGCCICMV